MGTYLLENLHASITEFFQLWHLTSIADQLAVVLANIGVPLSRWLRWRLFSGILAGIHGLSRG